MRYICIFILLLGVNNIVFSQDLFPVVGKVIVKDGNLNNIEIKTKVNFEQKIININNAGNFNFYLKWDKDYIISFSKPRYITKEILFSTKIPRNIDCGKIFPFEFIIKLIPYAENIDTAYYKEPVGKVYFSDIYNDFIYSKKYNLVEIKKERKLNIKPNTYKDNNKDSQNNKDNNKDSIHNNNNQVSDNNNNINTTENKIQKLDKFGLPYVKEDIPIGKTTEVFNLQNKKVTRVIIKSHDNVFIYYEVKHKWGARFYFIQEMENDYRSISEHYYRKAIAETK